VIDVLIDVLDGDALPDVGDQSVRLLPQVKGIVLDKLEHQVHRVGVDFHLVTPEVSHQPPVLLIVEHLPEDLLVSPPRHPLEAPGDGNLGTLENENRSIRGRGGVRSEGCNLVLPLQMLNRAIAHERPGPEE
jgi:hypothetical protein